MLNLVYTQCEVSQIKSELRHSFLLNLIINRNAKKVAGFYVKDAQSKVRKAFEKRLLPGGEFESRLKELRKLANSACEGFSPSQLVETTALDKMPSEIISKIKKAVHQDYLDETSMLQVVSVLNEAIDDFEASVDRFSKLWFSTAKESPEEIQISFEHLQGRAQRLFEALGKLPEGILL